MDMSDNEKLGLSKQQRNPVLVKQYGFKAGHLAEMQKILVSCHTVALWC